VAGRQGVGIRAPQRRIVISDKKALVFVVDDDSSVRESLKDLIRSAGLDVQTFSSAQEFLQSQRPNIPSCLLLDLQLPDLSGLDLQQELVKAGRFNSSHTSQYFSICRRAGRHSFSRVLLC
jgi:CheY-like chemotaxis protein